jgi:hypothetical protein
VLVPVPDVAAQAHRPPRHAAFDDERVLGDFFGGEGELVAAERPAEEGIPVRSEPGSKVTVSAEPGVQCPPVAVSRPRTSGGREEISMTQRSRRRV